MALDRRTLLGSGLLMSATLPAAAAAKDAPDPVEIIDLWPSGPPGAARVTVKEELTERRKTATDLRDRIVAHVTRPRLTVFRPRRPNGAAILIAPGGGYKWVVVDKEGFESREAFAARGYTCFVLSTACRRRLGRRPGCAAAGRPTGPAPDPQPRQGLRRRPGPHRRPGLLRRRPRRRQPRSPASPPGSTSRSTLPTSSPPAPTSAAWSIPSPA